MEPVRTQSGDLSQDSEHARVHPNAVPPLTRSVDRPTPSFGAAKTDRSLGRDVVTPSAKHTRKAYEALNASSVGLELGISVVLGLLAGYYLDKELGTSPWLLFVFLAFGLVAGFRGVLRYVQKSDRAAAKEAANG